MLKHTLPRNCSAVLDRVIYNIFFDTVFYFLHMRSHLWQLAKRENQSNHILYLLVIRFGYSQQMSLEYKSTVVHSV